jgi:2-C-methyl-D-erythritol 4-phosphate cytidylyltransferase
LERSVILVAGGSGARFGGPTPKQFLLLQGKPLLCWSIEAFYRYDPSLQIIVVLPRPNLDSWSVLCKAHRFHVPHELTAGGQERFHSVRNGMAHVPHNGLVAVHDGVRPLVSSALIERCFDHAGTHHTAIPVVPISSSVRQILGAGESTALLRSALRAVQTPQCFDAALLRSALELPYDASLTDEATLVERTGEKVHLVDGEERNIKVTSAQDLVLAEQLLAQ